MQYLALLPDLLTIVGGLVSIAAFAGRGAWRPLVPALAFLFAVAAFGVELWQGARLTTFAGAALAQDRFALFGKAAVLLTLALWIAASRLDQRFDDRLLSVGYLIAVGGLLVGSASVTPVLWLGLLLALGGFSLPFLLAPARRRDGRLAATLVGLLGCGLGLLGLGLSFHTWRLSTLLTAIPREPTSYGGGLLAILAVVGALAPLLGLAYAGRGEEAALGDAARRGAGRGGGERDQDAALVALLGGPLAIVLVLVATKLGAATFSVGVLWGPVLAVVATAAALTGSLAGLAARSVRGLVAWLTLGQAGWVAAALSTHAQLGLAASLFLGGALGLAGGAAPLLVAGLDGPRARLAGLAARQPGRALGLSVALLSLAGLPPAAGFFGLFWSGVPLVQGGSVWVLAGLLLAAGLGAWATVRVLLLLWIEPEAEDREHRRTTLGGLAGLLVAALLLAYCVVGYPASNLAIQAVEALGLFH